MSEIGKALALGLWLAFFAYMLNVIGPGDASAFTLLAAIGFGIWMATRD